MGYVTGDEQWLKQEKLLLACEPKISILAATVLDPYESFYTPILFIFYDWSTSPPSFWQIYDIILPIGLAHPVQSQPV